MTEVRSEKIVLIIFFARNLKKHKIISRKFLSISPSFRREAPK